MKPRKTITVPVAGRVSPEVQEWILEGADLHQMSTSEFVGYQLALAAQKRNNLEAFRQEQVKTVMQTEGLQQELTWYKAFPKSYLEVIQRNIVVLADFFSRHKSAPIPLHELRTAGFDPSHLLCYHTKDNKQLICLGNFSWHYSSPQKTHVCLIQNDGSSTT